VAAQRVAHVAHEVQAGVGLFHHHVEQDHGDVVFALEQRDRLGRGIGVQEFQRPAVHLEAVQRERRGRMHVRIVVDDQHAPGAAAVGRDCRRLVCEHQVVVLRGVRGRVRCGHVLRLQV